MKTFSVKGGTKYFGRFLPMRTYIASSIHVTMMSVVGTLPTRLLTRKYCKQDLYGHLCKEMRIFGVRHVMFVNAQGLDDLLMVLNNLSLPLGPFEKWGIDAIGPLPRTAAGKEYIIVGVDYMTRWAEAAPTSRITAKDVAKFVFDSICCRFGTPLEIISDRGPGFRGNLVTELMSKLSIKHRHSTPYYPQCNGLVEKVNGMICKIITKHVGSKAQTWDRHLNAALWAYRTSFKASLGFTLFHLVYGQEALLPIEVELSSLRVLVRHEGEY